MSLDDVKAHQLLQKSVEQDGRDYHSLYELACDFWKADQRTAAVKKREGHLAKSYFDKARDYAVEAKDQRYINMIDAYLKDYEKWDKMVKQNHLKVQ